MLTKIPIIKKKVQIKIVQNSISYKKLNGCICLSPPGVELKGSSSYSNRTFDEITMPNVWSPLSPLLRLIDINARLVFVGLEQFLFDPFFY